MTTTLQKLSVAALGATTVAMGSIAPAQAFELTYTFEGTTGSTHSYLYPEYQNAHFTGSFTVDSTDNDPSASKGSFKINSFFMEIVNDCFPDFRSTVTLGTGSASLLLGTFTTRVDDGEVDNHSTYNPTVASFQLFFNDPFFETNPNYLTATSPDPSTFVANINKSFLNLSVNGHFPLTIPVSSARVEAVPEPTTMAGLTVFGLGAYLKRRADRNRKKK